MASEWIELERTGDTPPDGGDPLPEPNLDRVQKTLFLIDHGGKGLEIGPSHSPIAPRAKGFEVQVVDVLSAEELRAKFRDDPAVDASAIEEVDFVWSGQSLPDLVGGTGRYDWVIASHVLEHLPDPISFLVGCEQVLRPGGVLSLVLPDKRTCFDHFRPLTTTGDWLNAFSNRWTRPQPGHVFDHFVNAVTHDGSIAWGLTATQPLRPLHTYDQALDAWRWAQSGDDYIDVHVWTLTPESFRLLMLDLSSLGISQFRIEKSFETTGHEFYVSLQVAPSVAAGPTDRFDLLLDAGGPTPVDDVRPEPQPELEGGPQPEPELEGGRSPASLELSELERSLVMGKRRLMTLVRRTARRRRP